MVLKKENLHEYYDAGLGIPFNQEEVIDFCVNNIHLFNKSAEIENDTCNACDNPGLSFAVIFDLTESENITSFKEYVSNFDELLVEYDCIESIMILHCNYCDKWEVTH